MLNLNDLRKLRFSNKKWFAISLPLLRFKCWRISAFRLLLSRSTLCFRRVPGSSKTRDVRKVWASGRMTNVKVTILWAVLGITGPSIASEESPYIYPSQDTVDARKLQPGALVLLEPSAPMSMKIVDLAIYSGAIDEGNRTKQKLLISSGRIFFWNTEHYMPCKVLSIGPYGICKLKNGIGQEAYTSAAFLHRALLANPPSQ
jgi:hypothetical protein